MDTYTGFNVSFHLSPQTSAKLPTLCEAQKMLAHPSGTLISHRVAEIISPRPNNTRHRPIFVGSLTNVTTLHANFGQCSAEEIIQNHISRAIIINPSNENICCLIAN